MNIKSVNPKLAALLLIAASAAIIGLFPLLKHAQAIQQTQTPPLVPLQEHRVEVVFVLDTTSSMSGLIRAAKEKIWSIANSMASAQQNPDIKMGLVAFRDRGDDYVTRVYDLSTDLDARYAQLMDFRAEGGGDGPESVNQALYDAIHDISWSQEKVYKVVFLVGDAPPHMDYADDVKYPVTLAEARRKGIVVNTIQSGQHQYTRPAWREIAQLGHGDYFQVEDHGNAVAVATPFDEQLAQLGAELEATRLSYGDAETKAKEVVRREKAMLMLESMPAAALASRSEYNASDSGRKNLLGEHDLVDAISSGRVELDAIPTEDLPASMQALTPEAQMETINEQAQRRDQLRQEIQRLSESRNVFIRKKIDAEGKADESLDEQIYRAVKKQAADAGLSYDEDRARY